MEDYQKKQQLIIEIKQQIEGLLLSNELSEEQKLTIIGEAQSILANSQSNQE